MEASNFREKQQQQCRQSTKHGFVRSKVILFIAPNNADRTQHKMTAGERGGGVTDLREMATAFPV